MPLGRVCFVHQSHISSRLLLSKEGSTKQDARASQVILPGPFAAARLYRPIVSIITADTIISDIRAVDTAVVTFGDHITAYNGGYLNATFFFTDLAAIVSTTAAVDTEGNLVLNDFTPADSTRIVDYYASSLGVHVVTTGQALLNKKPILDSMGFSEGTAVAEVTFQAGLGELARALRGKLTAEVEKYDDAAKRNHHALQEGVEAFSVIL